MQVLRVGARVRRVALVGALTLMTGTAVASSPSPYAGQEARDIKALSPQEVSDYLSGKGVGLAKAAELNGYPGPLHVLELGAELGLMREQQTRTEALFRKMQSRAVELGRELVEEEGRLDRLFASRSATSGSVSRSLARIGRLQGQIRAVHLDAHLEQTALLTPAQVESYRRLRGYGGGGGDTHPRHH
jgi:hypothetical protein